MTSQAKLLLFPGSLRKDSHQARLLKTLMPLLGACKVDYLEPATVSLPIFNQDLEGDEAVLRHVKQLHQRFLEADGFVIASPEYNGHVAPFVKNTVDWISRLPRIDSAYASLNPFREKPLLLVSASTGWTGGILGLQDARSIFSYLGCLVSSDQICVSDANQWTNGDTFTFEVPFEQSIESIVQQFLALISRIR
jgi:chromate reductase